MSVRQRLSRLEREVEDRRQPGVDPRAIWATRYVLWCRRGLPRDLPPPTHPFLNIEQFKALWRQVRGPYDPY
jgi:hypothetical protein